MAIYQYKAKDKIGNEIKGSIDAQNEKYAIDQLRQKNIFVVSISPVSKEKPPKKGKKIRRSEIVAFSRQLATMANAGLPILDSLNILTRQSEQAALKDILSDVTKKIEGGSNLSDSFGHHQRAFGPFFVNMLRAGESTGKLPLILNRIANYLEYIDNLQKKIKSAMMYPIIVTTACLLITIFLIVEVIPVFAKMYKDLGGELPLPTKILIDISDFVRNWFILVIIVMIAGIIAFKKWIETEKGKLIVDRLKFKIPIFGNLIRKIVISRFAKTLSVLTSSGIPILSALEIVKGVVGNKVVESALNKTSKAVRDGEGISVPLGMCPVFPAMVVKMIEVGERTGNLEDMLDKMAEYYDNEVNAAIAGLTSIIEPLLIVFLGIVIGGIVICMFLPIFKITTLIR